MAEDATNAALRICIEAHIPVFLVSKPGTTKSKSIEALARALDKKLWTLVLGTREPTDQGGLPAVFEERGKKLVMHIPPHWAREVIEAGGGIVFFDEITAANAQVMNSALRIIQEGIVGDSEKLPEATSFVLAGNYADSNVGSNDLTAGVANRACHLNWKPSYALWSAGMRNGFAPLNVPKLGAWKHHIQPMRELVVSFLDTDPDLVHAQPEDPAEHGKPWPSHRTWDITAVALAAAKGAGYEPTSEVARVLVAGLVGPAAQVLFTAFLSNGALPSMTALFADPHKHKLPTRQDELLATLEAVVTYAVERRAEDYYQWAWIIVMRVLEHEATKSLAIPACRKLMLAAPNGADDSSSSPYGRGLKLAAKHLKGSKTDYGRA